MKILYGVQGTGQGHISRARALALALRDWPVEVTWLFSGRARENLFDMDIFGDYAHRRGLTFKTRAGRMQYWATVRGNSLPRFLRDAREPGGAIATASSSSAASTGGGSTGGGSLTTRPAARGAG